MTPRYSPKPWRWYRGELLAADGERVISCSQAGDHECDRDGDELLIAAAPDLVEACRAAFDELLDVTPGDEDGSALELIRAALRKAGVKP